MTANRIAERMATRMTLRQLRLVVAVAEHGNILHAAGLVGVSQPAATKLLKDLELDLGVQLFTRTNRGAIPTDHGDILIRHGKLVFRQLANAAQELGDRVEGASGQVVVGTLLAASALWLPDAILRLKRERPLVSVLVREGTSATLMPALRNGEVDLIVGRLNQHRFLDEIEQEQLFDETVVAVARPGHPLTKRRKLALADVADCEWVLPPSDTTLRRQIDRAFTNAGLSPPAITINSVSLLTNRKLIGQSDMIGVWPEHVVSDDIERGLLGVLPLDLEGVSGAVG
ncbi:MAG: LysR family transcriptional regulator, partial [Pseudomonadota bacterium]